MTTRPFSADEAISFLARATQDLMLACQPSEVIDRLGEVLTQLYQAESLEVSGPYRGGLALASGEVVHSLREGPWRRELRLQGVQRNGVEVKQIALSAIQTAERQLETILQISTLSADLAQARQSDLHEDAETGLRRGLVRSLEWALERSVQLGSAVAIFQMEWASDLTEQERLEVTALLRASLRRVDRVVRLNPERVVVILEGLLAPDSVLRVEERLASHFRDQSMEFWAGVALSPVHAKTPERLLGLSERALHESRALGLRGFHHFGAASGLSWQGLES